MRDLRLTLIKKFLESHKGEFSILFNGLDGVNGPYTRASLLTRLAFPKHPSRNASPFPTLAVLAPILTHSLVVVIEAKNIQFGATSDRDDDRNITYGKDACTRRVVSRVWLAACPRARPSTSLLGRTFPSHQDLVRHPRNGHREVRGCYQA